MTSRSKKTLAANNTNTTFGKRIYRSMSFVSMCNHERIGINSDQVCFGGIVNDVWVKLCEIAIE